MNHYERGYSDGYYIREFNLEQYDKDTAYWHGYNDGLVDIMGFDGAEPRLDGVVEFLIDRAKAMGKESFALLVHGTQPKGSTASAAIKRLKAENVRHSYGKGAK